MKKLKLKALELGANEVLTRAQLKNVGGGVAGSGPGTIVCAVTWNSNFPVPVGTPWRDSYVCMNLNPNDCQAAADQFCSSGDYSESCVNIDCPGATNLS